MLRGGTVIRKDGERALVKVRRVGGTCETCVCEAGGGSGSCNPDNSYYATASNTLDAPVGARVEVEIKRSKILSTVLVVFWIPMILSGLLGYGVWEAGQALWGEAFVLLAAAGALTGLALGIALAVFVERRTTGKRSGVMITRILELPRSMQPEQTS